MIKRNTVYLSITSAALSVVLATQAFTAELTNVATRPNGARIAVEHDRKVVRNKETPPESMIDGNARSRCVMTGTPYTVILTMLEPVSIDHLLITASSYPTEAVAKDIEITFDDGATIQHTLEKLPATGNRPNWQRIPVGGKTSQRHRRHRRHVQHRPVVQGQSACRRFQLHEALR
jgi:hypothetical protein